MLWIAVASVLFFSQNELYCYCNLFWVEGCVPYQSGRNRRNNVQFGVGRSVWHGSPPPAIPELVFDGVPGFLAWLSLLLVVAGAVSNPTAVFTFAALIG